MILTIESIPKLKKIESSSSINKITQLPRCDQLIILVLFIIISIITSMIIVSIMIHHKKNIVGLGSLFHQSIIIIVVLSSCCQLRSQDFLHLQIHDFFYSQPGYFFLSSTNSCRIFFPRTLV